MRMWLRRSKLLDMSIDKKFIVVAGGLVKRAGKYNAKVRLHRDVIVDLPFEVVGEK